MPRTRRTTWMGSRSLDRRQLLGAGALGALGALGASRVAGASSSIPYSLLSPTSARPNPKAPIGTDLIPEIEHIVVCMMENHSYDNLVGTVSRGNGLTFVDGQSRPTNSNPDGLGGSIRSFAMPTTAQSGAPSQSWSSSWTQFLGSATAQAITPASFNSGFVVSPSGPYAMGYYTPAQMPFINWLAETYPLADAWHCSLLGQTDPNRRYMAAGTSLGLVGDSFAGPLPPNGTFFMSLMEHDISWHNYYDDLPSSLTWVKQLQIKGFTSHLKPIATFFSDAASGTLPAFSMVDPNFSHSSEEDPQDCQHGDVFLRAVVNALQQSPKWDKTLLLYTYDEHGGYYDHVPPARAPKPDNVKPMTAGWKGKASIPSFARTGFRVPAGIVSPFAKADYVTSTVFDHTSIMKLVEQKWNLPSFTARDAWAASPLEMIDLTAPPAFKTPPAVPDAVRDTDGNPVSIGLAGDDGPTADEVTYPVGTRTEVCPEDPSTSNTTAFCGLLEAAWSS